jgi:hypothetical protein
LKGLVLLWIWFLASKKMDRTSRACKIKTMGIVLAKEEILPRYLGVLNYARS